VPSITVKIAPAVLDWILGIATSEGVDDKFLSHCYQWKNEEKSPTFAKIEDLSKKAHIPLGYFFLQYPPVEDIPLMEYRTIQSTAKTEPSRNLLDTYYQMSSIQGWMRDYLIKAGNEKLKFVGSCKNINNVIQIAASIRSITGLSEDWYAQSTDIKASFNILRNCFEKLSILVLQNGVVAQNNFRKLDIEEFRAFTLIDDYAPLIFINNNDTPGGKLFSLLHEAVHIWLGLNSFFNDLSNVVFNISPLEILCNTVAAELLVPNLHFVDKWNEQSISSMDLKITNIAKHFKCGVITIARKALDNNFISKTQYQKYVADIIAIAKNQKAAKKETGGDYYTTAISRYGRWFILSLDNSLREGKTTYTEAFGLTNTSRKTFDSLVDEIRSKN
jgi:Zn-dependent peptidase ImmA (M78 family)